MYFKCGGDINDCGLLDRLFATYDSGAVIHFAAYAYVGELMQDPGRDYGNNVVGSLRLLEAIVAARVKNIVFSSACATYGIPDKVPITEDHPQRPINPYGHSKLMVEWILQDFERAYGMKSEIFRYFNAAGAYPDGLMGGELQTGNSLNSFGFVGRYGNTKSDFDFWY